MSYSSYQRFLSLPSFSVWGSYGKITNTDCDSANDAELLSVVDISTTSCLYEFVIADASTEPNCASSNNDVLCCMVCDKFFTKEARPENCWSCGQTVCRTCTTNKTNTHNDASVKNVLVCLHCDFGESHAKSDKECMCWFCQRVNGEEFAPEASFIVMDHEHHE